ncbi:hypothetical protein H0H92_003371 [Tricholoma furcatifolium]|nr:hypothetical protein H0H92_003371 [Tricholoma furcatifolium]
MATDVLDNRLHSIYSDGSEGSILRAFVDTQERRHTPTRKSTNTLPDDLGRHSKGPAIVDQRSHSSARTSGDPRVNAISTADAIARPEAHPYVLRPEEQRQSNTQPDVPAAMEPVLNFNTGHECVRGSTPREPEDSNSLNDLQRVLKSLYSADSEGEILRQFVDAQEEPPVTGVTRKSNASSRAFNGVIAGPSKRRSHQHSHSHHEGTSLDVSTEPLLRLLMAQKNETKNLRRELRLAVERVNTEAQRVIALERDNHQTIEQLMSLNESKVAAQREAMKAASELRLYQYQYENAQKEITRAQEMVKMVETQRNEAEEEASQAREKARKHLQERVVAAAKEEGRRLGFEAGLRQAQAEAGYVDPRDRNALGDDVGDPQLGLPPDDVDIDVISPPIRQRTPHSQRLNLPPEHSSPLRQPRVQSPTPPESEDFQEEEETLPPPQPPSLVPPAPEYPRAMSPAPSIQMYSIAIPPASELERQNSQNTYLGKSRQPWVTAQEYHQITSQQPSPENYPGNLNFQQGANVVTFLPEGIPGKKKESWLRRTLSRPWRKKQTTSPVTPTSSYQAKQGPPVLVRDFGAGSDPPLSSYDSTAASTYTSQFDLQPGPLSSSSHGSSERGLRSGVPPKGRRRTRDRETVLSVIDENPLSRSATERKDTHHRSPNMGEIRSLMSQESNYADRKNVDEWRRSSASVPKDVAQAALGHGTPREHPREQKPPRRRPAHLTVPSPLAPSSQPQYLDTPGPRVVSTNSQDSASFGLGSNRPGLQRNVTVGTLVGITVEPPSRSPTEAPASGRPPQTEFLSPSFSTTPHLPSGPSIPSYFPQNRHSNPVASLSPQQGQSRPGSMASRSQPSVSQSRSPVGTTSSRPLPSSNQFPFPQQVPEGQPRRSSVASRATMNAPVSVRSENPSAHGFGLNLLGP